MSKKSTARAWYELLSSMRFAISLLTVLAIASIIGTVLKQNEPYNNYLNQFGQFWFPVFEKMGLYSVYHAGWFLLILVFLVLSTSACILRQAPAMLKDMKSYREHAREVSLRQFAHHAVVPLAGTPAVAAERVRAWLEKAGFTLRANPREDGLLLAARKGTVSRWGYILAHGAIVLICLGGLLDGNLPLKLQMALGAKQVTKGNQLVSDVPASSRLGMENWSFRGNLFIPEGKSVSFAILNLDDGILVQDLPFSVSLKKFHIEHYSTGMPKRFASDILITDKTSGKSIERTLEVNKPFEYAGLTLYQASFDDGGSKLHLKARNLSPGATDALAVEGEVNDSVKLTQGGVSYTAEFTAFRPFNVENMATDDTEGPTGIAEKLGQHLGSGAKSAGKKDLKNVGPSFQFKLRDAAGQAREYNNYMQPIEQDGRMFLLSGMRENPAEPFRFMRMPLAADDKNGKPDSFLALRALALDARERPALARRFAAKAMSGEAISETMKTRLADTAERTLQLFAEGGLSALGKYIEKTVPEKERDKAADVFLKVLEGSLWEAWQTQRERAHLPALQSSSVNAAFIRDSVNAINDSLHYGAPLFLQLEGFDLVQATGIQVTRSPGKGLVFLGSLMLVLGVLAMFYIRERRLFVLLKDSGEAVVAMSANRKTLEFEQSWREHRDALTALLASEKPV